MNIVAKKFEQNISQSNSLHMKRENHKSWTSGPIPGTKLA